MGGIKKLGIITVMVLLLCSGCGKKALPVEDYVSSNEDGHRVLLRQQRKENVNTLL